MQQWHVSNSGHLKLACRHATNTGGHQYIEAEHFSRNTTAGMAIRNVSVECYLLNTAKD
jgi:hypothetical protein